MAINTLDDIIKTWYPDKRDLVKWVYDLAKYLQDNPIPSEDQVATIINNYLTEHPIDAPVTSVNGKTGAVVLDADSVGALPLDGGVLDGDLAIVVGGAQILLTASNDGQAQIVLNAEQALDARTVLVADSDGHLQISIGSTVYTIWDSGNYTPPAQSVTSVNGKTGAVVLGASDVGALADTYTAPVNSVNGETGNVYVDKIYSTYPNDAFTATSDNAEASATWEYAGSTQTLKIDTDGSVTANGVTQYSPANPPPAKVYGATLGGSAITVSKGLFTIRLSSTTSTQGFTVTTTNAEINWIFGMMANTQANTWCNVWPRNATQVAIVCGVASSNFDITGYTPKDVTMTFTNGVS